MIAVLSHRMEKMFVIFIFMNIFFWL